MITNHIIGEYSCYMKHFLIFLKLFKINSKYIYIPTKSDSHTNNIMFDRQTQIWLYVNTTIYIIRFLNTLEINQAIKIYILKISSYPFEKNTNNNNNNIHLQQLGCHPVAVVILHVYKT